MSNSHNPSPDHTFMRRALEIALAGMGNVAPNPMVGAVIARENRILSEGFHANYGESHAERIAIENAKKKGIDLKGSTLYVTLEPCAHKGKTPPCTEAIIEAGISRVCVATTDPNPQVAGKGIEILKNAGIAVELGLLEEEAKHINRRFFTFHTKKRPYIILKWAQTLDGFIDSNRQENEPPEWITNNECRRLVHKWRTQEMAILVGTNTAAKDNPQLNVRFWHGRNPLRVVLDRTLRVPPESNIFDGSSPTLIVAGKNQGATTRADAVKSIPNLELLLVDFMKGGERMLLQELYSKNITSLIVEGGTLLLNNFLKRDLWDEARIFFGNRLFKRGVQAPQIPDAPHKNLPIGDTLLHLYTNPTPRGL